MIQFSDVIRDILESWESAVVLKRLPDELVIENEFSWILWPIEYDGFTMDVVKNFHLGLLDGDVLYGKLSKPTVVKERIRIEDGYQNFVRMRCTTIELKQCKIDLPQGSELRPEPVQAVA